MSNGLRTGDPVRVRSEAEIRVTLDSRGCLDGLPFMPEMVQFCGRQFRVHRRADKTCDTIGNYTSRRMEGAVHLEGLRCDGAAHGGCQAGCLLFWREAWLERVTPGDAAEPAVAADPDRLSERLMPFTLAVPTNGATEPIFACQATELNRASVPLSWWDVRQYARELVSGNVGPWTFIRTMAIAWYNAIQRRLAGREYPYVPVASAHAPARWWDPRPYFWQLRAGRLPVGTFVRAVRASWRGANGSGASATNGHKPAATGLKPGDRVRVRSLEQIAATLTSSQRLKGLWFDVEMVPYCGKEYRVLRRVDKIVDERTGRMIRMKNDCLILDEVVCSGCLSRNRLFCPRALYPYWREAWLERVE